MKSIQARFEREQKNQPQLSDLTNFIKSVRSQHFARKTIHQNFKKLVNPEDYMHLSASERKELMAFMERVNMMPEDG